MIGRGGVKEGSVSILQQIHQGIVKQSLAGFMYNLIGQ